MNLINIYNENNAFVFILLEYYSKVFFHSKSRVIHNDKKCYRKLEK